MSNSAMWKACGELINMYGISLFMLHLNTQFPGSYIVCLQLFVLFLPKPSISLPVTSLTYPPGFQLSNMLHFLPLLCSYLWNQDGLEHFKISSGLWKLFFSFTFCPRHNRASYLFPIVINSQYLSFQGDQKCGHGNIQVAIKSCARTSHRTFVHRLY